jgi:putative Ca2+/H+ antiporter (TMEM165/GDT1 family)
LGALSFVVKILDILLKSKSLIVFFKKNKAFSVCLSVGLLVMTCSSFWLIEYHKDYVQYGITKNDNNLVKKIHFYLKECGDKTAISISSISTVSKDDVWVGSFKIAKACDVRSGENCIINLEDRNPSLYLEDQEIKFNSYFF